MTFHDYRCMDVYVKFESTNIDLVWDAFEDKSMLSLLHLPSIWCDYGSIMSSSTIHIQIYKNQPNHYFSLTTIIIVLSSKLVL